MHFLDHDFAEDIHELWMLKHTDPREYTKVRLEYIAECQPWLALARIQDFLQQILSLEL